MKISRNWFVVVALNQAKKSIFNVPKVQNLSYHMSCFLGVVTLLLEPSYVFNCPNLFIDCYQKMAL